MKLSRLLAFVLLLFAAAAQAEPDPGSAAALRGTYAALADRLAAIPFGRPLVLEWQSPEQAERLDFDYRAVTHAADFMETVLQAESGPAGTRDYRIRLEAAPLDAKRSFVALSYSYAYGLAARIALNAYLATAGSGTVAFTVPGRQADGGPELVGGLRGVVERNVEMKRIEYRRQAGLLSRAY